MRKMSGSRPRDSLSPLSLYLTHPRASFPQRTFSVLARLMRLSTCAYALALRLRAELQIMSIFVLDLLLCWTIRTRQLKPDLNYMIENQSRTSCIPIRSIPHSHAFHARLPMCLIAVTHALVNCACPPWSSKEPNRFSKAYLLG